MTTTILFFISLVVILYTYLGYPLLLYIQSKLFPRAVTRNYPERLPKVSVVIAARNEALNIENRIRNLLEQDYPAEKYEIIVVSDGSDDGTEKIVNQIADEQAGYCPEISCHAYTPSQGKPTALNTGVTKASGEIIIFTDARQLFATNVITELVANFSDPKIGGVSGELIFVKDGTSNIEVQMGAYWQYEKMIRKMESKTGSVVGVTGAIYAIRKELYQHLQNSTILDDVMTPMNIAMQGYRIIFDSSAVAYDVFSKDTTQEWRRKVRTLAGNWQMLSLNPSLMLPHRNPLWFRFISHKIARITVPFFLILFFVTGLLQEGISYYYITIVQVLFYSAALIAFFIPSTRNFFIFQISYFFCVLNLAAIKGFFIWITGGCKTIWTANRS
ncbi:glycosyltransferase family 2 protein [Desulfomarina sp.]